MTCVSEAPTDKLRPSGCAVRERGAALLIAISVIIGSASFRHGNTYDLAFPIDGACRLKKQKSVSGDQVLRLAIFPSCQMTARRLKLASSDKPRTSPLLLMDVA